MSEIIFTFFCRSANFQFIAGERGLGVRNKKNAESIQIYIYIIVVVIIEILIF